MDFYHVSLRAFKLIENKNTLLKIISNDLLDKDFYSKKELV